MFIVYKATHKPSGKFYIGQTSQKLEIRIGQHWGLTDKKQKAFQTFLQTTKMEDWIWEILVEVATYQESRDAEMYYIKTLKAYDIGLNKKPGYGTNTAEQRKISGERMKIMRSTTHIEPWNKGRKGCFSEETLNLMRLAKLEKPSRPVYTEEDKIRKSLQATNSKKIKELKSGLEFNSISRAAKHFNLRRESVRDVVNGKRTHTAGYVFIVIDNIMEQK
jgi:group I intron endonuclease